MAVRRSAPSNPTPSPDAGRFTVPSLNQDPIQSLRPWPVVITYRHRDFEIPALPAVDWLTVLMPDDLQLDDVFPGLLPDGDIEWVEDQLIEGHLSVEELRDLAIGVIETVSARKWWVALRLIQVARSSWDVLGPDMMLRGVNADHISLSGWLDILLITILKNMDPKDVTMFAMRLEAPPPEEAAPEELEMDSSDFLALGND